MASEKLQLVPTVLFANNLLRSLPLVAARELHGNHPRVVNFYMGNGATLDAEQISQDPQREELFMNTAEQTLQSLPPDIRSATWMRFGLNGDPRLNLTEIALQLHIPRSRVVNNLQQLMHPPLRSIRKAQMHLAEFQREQATVVLAFRLQLLQRDHPIPPYQEPSEQPAHA